MNKTIVSSVKFEPIASEGVLVWVKEGCSVDKNTRVTVPEGFRMRVCRNGDKIAHPIRPCNNEFLKDKLPLNGMKKTDSYSFYYYISDEQLLTYKWGTGALAHDSERQMDYQWGAYGTFSVTVEDALKLFDAFNRCNPLTLENIDEKVKLLLGGNVKQEATRAITSMIADKRLTVLDLNRGLNEVGEQITGAMRAYGSVSQKIGIKFVSVCVENINIPNEEDINRVCNRKEE